MKPNVIAGLFDIRSVVQSKETEPFDRLIKAGVDYITDLLVDGGVIDSHGKVVDLTQKENRVTIDIASIDARLVDGRDKPSSSKMVLT